MIKYSYQNCDWNVPTNESKQAHPTSTLAKNLRACNNFRLYNGRVATDELRSTDFLEKHMSSNDLLLHNSVVFNNGQKAPQVLPRLLDVIPEAKINLVIHYLRNDEIESASDLIDDLEPKSPQEFILKGIVNTYIGQMKGDLMAIRDAQKYFQHVGVSSSECDTIPGRQCMASCFFLLKQFKDALIYLSSIKNYLGKKNTSQKIIA